MEHHYQDGKIIVHNRYFEDTIYHISNECISVILNGKGAIVGYAPANEKNMLNACFSMFFNNKPIDIYSNKTVEMIGRCQTIFLHLDNATLKIKQFLTASVNGVFVSYELIGRPNDILSVSVGLNINMEHAVYEDRNREIHGKNFRFGATAELSFSDMNKAVYFDISAGKPVQTFLSCGNSTANASLAVSEFETHEKEMQAEIDALTLPEHFSEEQKALFCSSYFCSLQNYKSLDGYQAFMAGHQYLLPMRSYYRDSYYTVLPMYRNKTDLIRNQIITLATGISENGDCPSAVKSDYSEWWGNHYDSPSFLAIMLYDYVKHTQDTSILSQAIKQVPVIQRAEKAIQKLSLFADQTSLIYKEGPYNQRDWADEVNRNGYVTYNEALYARALFCLSKLYHLFGDEAKASAYAQKFETVKKAINEILWDDELGYYINFKEKDFTEKNLSVDTCFVALFGIADDDKAIRMLKNMELLLETRNNKQQKAGDYGVMCVYPFYSRIDGARNKSAQPYYYHNGANWPYLSAMYAATKRKYGMEYRYALESWFDYNVKRGNYTPIEFFSPPQKDGSLLQAWSGVSAFVMDEEISKDFWND